MTDAGHQPKPCPPRQVPEPGRAVTYWHDLEWPGSKELPMREDATVLTIQRRDDGLYRAVAFDVDGRARDEAARESLDEARDWCAARVPEQSEDNAHAWLRDEARRAGESWARTRDDGRSGR